MNYLFSLFNFVRIWTFIFFQRRESGKDNIISLLHYFLQSLRKDPLEEEAYKEAFSVITVPPSMIVRRLASAIE